MNLQESLFAPKREPLNVSLKVEHLKTSRVCLVAAINAALLQAGHKSEASEFLRGCRSLDVHGVIRHAKDFLHLEDQP